MLKKQIEDFCMGIGLDTIGFTKCRRFDELEDFYKERQKRGLQNEFEEHDLEKRLNPNLYMPEGKTIIAIAFPYYCEEEEEEVNNGFSIYTKRLDYHRVVHHYLEQVKTYIESLGGKALTFVDSNPLPERYIAYQAGLGFIGRNNMLITEQYGSYVFLGEIITDLEIPCDQTRTLQELKRFEACKTCTTCLEECPTKSIHKGGCNPNICLSYLTQKKELTNQEISLLKGNVFGCDFCQLKCPYNQEAQRSRLEAFKGLDYMNEEVFVYANMNNAYFKENISQTSCGWRGKNVIRRNAIIELAKQGEEIEQFRGDSPYINGYIERLIQKK